MYVQGSFDVRSSRSEGRELYTIGPMYVEQVRYFLQKARHLSTIPQKWPI